MALAMLGFTFNDALTKTLTTSLNVGQIMLARGVILTFLVYLAAQSPQSGLWPSDLARQADVLRWLFWQRHQLSDVPGWQ